MIFFRPEIICYNNKIEKERRNIRHQKKIKVLLAIFALACVFALGLFNVCRAANFQPDPTVTAIGKAAARAREVLNWTLTIKDAGFSQNAGAIKNAWQKIVAVNTIVVFIILVIIAFGLIFRASWAREQKRTVVILLIALAASYLSYAVSVTIIKTVDNFQSKLARISTRDAAGHQITRPLRAEDLLSVSFKYQDFQGFKNTDPNLEESINNNLLLVKLTTWTTYVIAGVIILRIVLLWLLVIFSPFIFPCLAFSAIRNVAIVWLREFGRWLFLGPLFIIFLVAVPYIWQQTKITPTFLPSGVTRQSGIPLQTGTDNVEPPSNIYQSGTNIILLPPGVSGGKMQMGNEVGSGNNLSETDTYMRYIIALLMIWAAIILPFLLLRIIMSISIQAGNKIINTFNQSAIKNYLSSVTTHNPPPEPKTPPPGPIIKKEIIQKNLPFVSGSQPAPKIVEREIVSKINEKMPITQLIYEAGVLPEVSKMATSSREKLSQLTKIEQNKEILQKSSEVLDKISNPEKIENQQEQQKYSAIKNSIYMKSLMGEKTATSLNNAITKNITHYLSSNVANQIYQNSLNNFSKNLTSIYQGDESSTKIFQQTYKVPDKTLYDYLLRLEKQLSKANQTSQPIISLSIKAINKIKESLEYSPEQDKKNVVAQIATKLTYPEKIKDEQEKQEYTALKRVLEYGQKVGDENFVQLEKEGAVVADLLNLQTNPSPENLDSATNSIVETIDKDADFANSKLMWKKHYLEAPVPAGKTRKEWIQDEIKKLQSVLNGFISPQEMERKKALDETKEILPFMMVGGYDATDIVRYIKAKLKAAKEALSALTSSEEKTENEDDLVAVKAKKESETKENQMQMASEEPQDNPQSPMV